ncbi:uncharacterized protein LOC106652028 [Trichogramma pretiosum]|uniref:uncharacterized protein LOC106652028 n=1 Tax=Trichogramma pretiosum TaxID=7493 RepID=UPI0006C9A8D5|nr:uncharacterized protein LOC106652028 [Trichogramma pretiosum]
MKRKLQQSSVDIAIEATKRIKYNDDSVLHNNNNNNDEKSIGRRQHKRSADLKIGAIIEEARRQLQKQQRWTGNKRKKIVVVSKRTDKKYDYVLLMLRKPIAKKLKSSSRRRSLLSNRQAAAAGPITRERLLRVYASLKQQAWRTASDQRDRSLSYQRVLARFYGEKIQPTKDRFDWICNWMLKRAVMDRDPGLVEWMARCPLTRIVPLDQTSGTTTVVHLAAAESTRDVIPARLLELLLARCDPRANPADPRTGLSHLHVAASTGNCRLIGALLDAGADPNLRVGPPGTTPLHCAVREFRWEAARLLLARGADPSLADREWARTPLHCLCARFAEPLPPLEDAMKLRILGELLGHPTGPRQLEARDRHGNTALHELLGTPSLGPLHHYGLAMLLARGARVNAANLNGSTALHQVVKITRFNRESGQPEEEDCSSGMVGYLLSLGADTAALDSRLTSPMQLACNRLNFWAMDSLMQAGVVEDWTDFRLDLGTIKNRPYLDFCFNVLDLMELAQVRGHQWDERQESRVLEALLSPERLEAGYRERVSSVLQLGSEREIRAYFDARAREIQELGDRDPPTRSYLTGRVLRAIHVPIGLHSFGLKMPQRVYRYLVDLFNRLQSGPDRVEFLRDDIAALNTEMEYTKNVPIGDGRRLHELLGLAPEEGIEPRHIAWLDHPCAQEVLRKRIFYTMYPRSGGYIEAHVAKCLLKRFAARLGARLLGLLAPYRGLPDLVCREIVGHLAPEDILNVARATKHFL